MTNDNDRVRAHTTPDVLDEIDRQIKTHVEFYSTQSRGAISARIEELEQEWDIERVLEINASSLALTGLVLGATASKKWLWLTGGVLTFLVQHAIQGWCPPLALFRRSGIRTRSEIDCEKYALKALRGDFEKVPVRTENNSTARAHNALLAARV